MSNRRSRGAILLAQTGRTQEEIAARCGCSKALAGHWLTGERKPTKKYRLILKRAYKIPITTWDVYPAETATAAASRPVTIDEAWQSLLQTANDAIVQAGDVNKSASERQRLAKFARDTMAEFEKRRDIPESKIIENASFKRVLEVLRDVIKKHPETLLELDRRLAELDPG